MKKFLRQIAIIFNGAYDTSTSKGRSLERNRRILLTSITGSISKLLSMAIPLITVKITYNYLGEELYGLWSATTSFFAIFQFADLGLANGLKTKLSHAYGREDLHLSRQLISSTYSVLTIISMLILLVFIIMYPIIDWARVVNAETEKAIALAGGVVFAIVFSRILMIPLSLVNRTQLALQEGYRSNIWTSFSYILSLVLIYVVSKLDLGILTMIWVSSMIVVIVATANMFFYFNFQRKEYKPSIKMVDRDLSKSLLRTGFNFFILSILTTVGLSLDNFIVARTISLSEAASYSILYKVTHMIGGVTTMLSAPMWAANGEAFSRGETGWIKHNTKKMAGVLFMISTLASIVLILIANTLFRLWLGNEFEFSILVLIGMLVLQILLSVVTSYFMVLNALGIVRIQILLFAIYTPLSFILKYVFAIKIGSLAIPWVGSITYLIFILIPVIYITNKKLKQMSEVS